jgi:predicted dehydrogenase
MAMNRRHFVVSGMSAAAYARVPGANDRLRLALVGAGTQGSGLLRHVGRVAAEANATVAAVCDLWTRRRDSAGLQAKALTGSEPRRLQRLDEVLAMKDVDGVILATPDHQHARQLRDCVRAGKDVFCEKPMGNVLGELKEAYRVAKASRQVVQLGTQGLSTGHYQAAAAWVRNGALGKISRVQHEASFNGPRWRPIPAVNEIRAAETDWAAWLMGRPRRPFDPHLYFEFRLYREFSNGIPDQWLTHAIAGVHHIMDDHFPESVVASGGVMVYKDGRENSDTFAATFTYPKGFVFSYAAQFGNDYPGHVRYFGQNGTLERSGDEGGGYVARGLGGGKRPERLAEEVRLEPIRPVSHMKNWLDCMRSRATPNADLLSGYAHSVASIMAAQAERTGKKVYWDRKREEIVDRPVA